jgi:aconitate hydratase
MFTGELPEGATATDLVLHVVEMLRAHGVVGRFVEYFGSGLSKLTLPDRATLANMAPEYGATIGFFPVDDETLAYLRGSSRSAELVERVERISKEQRLFRTDETPDPEYTEVLHMDLGDVEPSVAGPKRPQDRIALADLAQAFVKDLPDLLPSGFSVNGDGPRTIQIDLDGKPCELGDGSVVIAAITSCTNTSNPSVMVGAGLMAKRAVELGLEVKPWVKSSMAPGSKVVSDYLEAADLMQYLDRLGFGVVGYGCTTCIGNSGPLAEPIAEAVRDEGLVVAAVLSGNRNFEARIHPDIRANYLASPMLVVAYALAGRVDIDWQNEPLGQGADGPIFLRDLWPGSDTIQETVQQALVPEMFERRYAEVFEGNDLWQALPLPEDDDNLYDWEDGSTYIRNPPFFQGMSLDVVPPGDIEGARVLGVFGQTTTTDHISPAGAIPKSEPAGRYLQEQGVKPWQFNTFGARRGNHEVMIRGTFGNVRIRNLMLDDREGGYTVHIPSGEELPIYDAAMRYQAEGTPLIVIAGREYGTGSSRDWAAKGTLLLGVKAVIAESYERIHRSNLVGMGVLPLQFEEGETPESLGLTGREAFDILGVSEGLKRHARLTVVARNDEGHETRFTTVARLDSDVDVDYYRNGGILHTVLRRIASGQM